MADEVLVKKRKEELKHAQVNRFLETTGIRKDAHNFFFNGRTTKVWVPPPPYPLENIIFSDT